jgi:hypothetical protein
VAVGVGDAVGVGVGVAVGVGVGTGVRVGLALGLGVDVEPHAPSAPPRKSRRTTRHFIPTIVFQDRGSPDH